MRLVLTEQELSVLACAMLERIGLKMSSCSVTINQPGSWRVVIHATLPDSNTIEGKEEDNEDDNGQSP